MTNYHFISIFIICCILLGIQSSVSAQSSDWVYSPYAQYLTNDTTIPPPVGEPSDAALSCFRHDTIYVLVMPTGQLYIWLRPDPLLDKYINLSPYAYCNGNPLRIIDPNGMDWYQSEDGTAVCWQKGNASSISVDGITYNNIGENYNHTVGNTTYGYNQNDLASIKYTTNTEFYQQQKGDGCKKACEAMVKSAGFIPEPGWEGEILMATHDANGVVNGSASEDVIKQGIYRLENYITNGMPCIIGIDYKKEQVTNNKDGMTDHFLTVVGLMYNLQTGTTNYFFYDPGSWRGASPNNVMNLVGGFLQGKTTAYGNPFKVTTIRRTKQ